MSKKEQKIQERALELWYLHDDWCEWKALAAAVREEMEKEQRRKSKNYSLRQIGLLEYWD